MSEGARVPAGASHQSAGPLSLDDPQLYVNRELALLKFQERVLE
jgi:polyphosphate kinase